MAEKIVVASGKGGVGKSSCTVAIGKELANRGYRVLLVDTDTSLRSLDVLLGVSDRVVFDWGDVICERCSFSKAIIKCKNVSLISCPLQNDERFTPEAMKKTVMLYDKMFDYIIIDSPAGVDIGLDIACAAADRALIISTSDKICVRSASRAAQRLYDTGIEDIRLIINRFVRKSVRRNKLLNIDSVIDSTSVQLIGVVPEDENITFGIVMKSRSQPSYQPFVRITNRILGKEEPLNLNF
ncbi:MAG: P-loop NTPase [Acutalibacteraceae bacterium]